MNEPPASRRPTQHPDHLADVEGLRVGHHTLATRATGCTVVLCPEGTTGGVDVRGGAPGTRETDLLAPSAMVDQVHAVLLTGGSAFGLDAAGGVMRWLEARGVGLRVGRACVPIVPAAVLFDLWHGDVSVRPDAAAGWAACEAATAQPMQQGAVGAGAGATVGKLFGFDLASAGGIGSASVRMGDLTVSALIAVNAVGDVVDPSSGRIVAGARDAHGNFIDTQARLLREGRHPLGSTFNTSRATPPSVQAGGATVIGVIATNANLSKAQCQRLAMMAHDGLARTICPSHTPADGDTLFALATGRCTTAADMMVLGAMAAQVTQTAVLRAVA